MQYQSILSNARPSIINRMPTGSVKRAAFLLVLAVIGAGPAAAQIAGADQLVRLTYDRTSATSEAQRNAANRDDQVATSRLKAAAANAAICLDLRVKVDGSRRFVVMTSDEEKEGAIVQRSNVACGPTSNGRLPMASGVEYYVKLQSAGGKRTDVAIYPGIRTTHILNDASCNILDGGRAAEVRLRGLYHAIINRYRIADDSGNMEIEEIQLRPVPQGASDIASCGAKLRRP